MGIWEKEMKVIRTERLILEELTKENLERLQEKQIEEQLAFFNINEQYSHDKPEFYSVKNEAALELKIERIKASWDTSLHIVMKDITTNKVIGHCGFYRWFKEHRRSEIGYILNKEYRKKGLVREAVRELLKLGFEELNINRMEAIIEPRNGDSENVVNHFGFKKEGVLRQHYISNDVIMDSMVFCLLREEWILRKD